MSGGCSTYEGEEGLYRVLVGKPEEKRPLGKPSRRWDDNIKLDHQDMGWGQGLDKAGSG